MYIDCIWEERKREIKELPMFEQLGLSNWVNEAGFIELENSGGRAAIGPGGYAGSDIKMWLDVGVRAGDADVKVLGMSKVLQITLIEGVMQGKNTDREGPRTDSQSC